MASKLKTDWKRIGRSGPTVDGRAIEPEALRQAAKNYDKNLFTALMWPEHERWYNMGTVEQLRAEDNDEGGVDLFAIIAPNEYYEAANRAGQKLFTSMELFPDFRNTGEFYLTGCAATDNPASAATSEMRFTASKETTLSLGTHTEFTSHEFNDSNTDDEQAPSWFTKFFNKKPEADMSKQAIEQLKTELVALTDKFNAALADKTPDSPAADVAKDETENFTALAASVTALSERFTALETKLEKGAEDEGEGNAADLQFTALQTALDDLTAKFAAATAEQPSTPAGEHVSGDDLNQYI